MAIAPKVVDRFMGCKNVPVGEMFLRPLGFYVLGLLI